MILKIFLIWRAGLFLLTYLGSKAFPLVENGGIGAIKDGKNFDFVKSWAQWDGGHYFNIASLGYLEPNQYAFFPLFPTLVKLFSFFTFGHILVSGLILTNLSFLLFLIVIHKLVKEKFGSKTAFYTQITYLVFPTTYFAVAFYNEAFFLLFSSLAFLLLNNKRYLESAIFISLASLTRFVGVVLILSLIVFFLETVGEFRKKLSLKILAVLLSGMGIVSYCSYLYFKFKDPFYFFTVETTWHRKLTNPILTIYNYFTSNFWHKPFNDYLDLFLPLIFIAILVLGFKKIRFSWFLFSFLVIIIPASTGTLTSMPRYLLAAFPVFILFANYIKDKKLIAVLLWTISLLGQIALAIMFVNGHWTA